MLEELEHKNIKNTSDSPPKKGLDCSVDTKKRKQKEKEKNYKEASGDSTTEERRSDV